MAITDNDPMDEFHSTVDRLIALNKAARQRFSSNRHEYSNPQWLQHFCTVSANIGRMTGKSEFIRRRVGPDDLILAGSREYLDHLYRGLECAKETPRTAGKISRDKVFKTIYVDEPFFVFKEIPVHQLYSLVARDTEQTIVLLGDHF